MAKELSNMEIVAYALYQLGGAEGKIHTERIAERCYQLAPKQFSWRLPEFSHLPDKDIVRVTLYDAAKDKYGHQVDGRSGFGAVGKETDGWALTHEGVQWVIANEARLAATLAESPGPRTKRSDAQKIRKRFSGSPVYLKFIKEGSLESVTQYELTDMLNCSPDASPSTVQKKFARLRAEGALLQDEKVTNFLEHVAQRLGTMSR